jgi:hypothetical protein
VFSKQAHSSQIVSPMTPSATNTTPGWWMQNGEQSFQAQNAINENAQSQTENKIHAIILQMLAIFVITISTFRLFKGGDGNKTPPR